MSLSSIILSGDGQRSALPIVGSPWLPGVSVQRGQTILDRHASHVPVDDGVSQDILQSHISATVPHSSQCCGLISECQFPLLAWSKYSQRPELHCPGRSHICHCRRWVNRVQHVCLLVMCFPRFRVWQVHHHPPAVQIHGARGRNHHGRRSECWGGQC